MSYMSVTTHFTGTLSRVLIVRQLVSHLLNARCSPSYVTMVSVMADRRRPYGAIRWDDGTEVDDCITAVRAFDEVADALGFIAGGQDGSRWAVVDLRTMSVVARNP